VNYSIPTNEVFIETVRSAFKKLTDVYGYQLTDVVQKDRYAKLIYECSSLDKKIEIINATNHVDYGFSFFIYNTTNNEYNIAANTPIEREDSECEFVIRAAEYIFENIEQLISGSQWETFGRVLHQE
jgi:hypothetical protein